MRPILYTNIFIQTCFKDIYLTLTFSSLDLIITKATNPKQIRNKMAKTCNSIIYQQ